jgi:hypothetical protein
MGTVVAVYTDQLHAELSLHFKLHSKIWFKGEKRFVPGIFAGSDRN